MLSELLSLFASLHGLGLLFTILVPGVGLGYWACRVLEPKIGELKRQLKEVKAERDEQNGKREKFELELGLEKAKTANFNAIREALFGEEDELWQLNGAEPPANYASRLAASKPKILTIANFKGGVGKTTLAANLIAYLAANRGLRVLAIDLDYQGSLSETLLRTVGQDFAGSVVDDLINGTRDGAEIKHLARPLSPALPASAVLTSDYSLARTENRVMLSWLLRETKDDVRFRLGRCLLDDHVQDNFDVVVIDAPPRLTTAAVAALTASHHVIIPCVPDHLSVPAVGRFLKQVSGVMPELNAGLNVAGVVLNLTQGANLLQREDDAKASISDEFAFSGNNGHIFDRHIPRLAALASAAGQNIAYLGNQPFRQAIMDPLGDEIAQSIGLGAAHES